LASPPQNVPSSDHPSSRNQLERALLALLASGPANLLEQVQYVLELSMQVEAQPAPEIPPPRPLTPAQARVTALTQMAEQLSEAQLIQLYKDIQAVDDLETRLLNSARLALLLPPQYFQTIVSTIWNQSSQLTLAEAR